MKGRSKRMAYFCLFLIGCRIGEYNRTVAQVRDNVLALEYAEEIAGDFARMASDWRKDGNKPALNSLRETLQEKRMAVESDSLQFKQMAQVESRVITQLADILAQELTYHKDYYLISDVIAYKKSNCLGYVQAVQVIGQALQLSVEAVNVLELHDGIRAYRQGKGMHHTASLFTLSDHSSLMVDLAYDLGGGSHVSAPFFLQGEFQSEGIYLVMKKEIDLRGVHRKIQRIDGKGIVGLKWFQMGVEYAKCGKNNSASTAFTRALGYNPELAEAYNNLAIVYAHLGQFTNARVCLRKCLSLNDAHANAHYNLGNEYDRTGQTMEALKAYSRAIELDSLHARAYYYRGLSRAALGKKRAAAQDLRMAMQLDASLASLANKGIAKQGLGATP